MMMMMNASERHTALTSAVTYRPKSHRGGGGGGGCARDGTEGE